MLPKLENWRSVTKAFNTTDAAASSREIRPFHDRFDGQTARTMQIETFTGGLFDTNAYFLPESGVLIDAPQDCAEWLARRGHRVSNLLLTHGHIDHVWDAARLQREHGCVVAYHRDTEPMVTQPGFFRSFGFAWDIEPLAAGGVLIEETESHLVQGISFRVLLVPGHCPGSLCFLEPAKEILFGGDVLFAGGIGRWDLPGGDEELLLEGIRNKLYPLGDDVRVFPGHGPATTIGRERQTNPFV
ncbi:MAG: MBL fold metallo-hydrolase [Verrucomicrobiota bacterium]|nr:MBL fold metallo-hydrolase [Verrucomicrobiota bacterium]